VAGVAVGAIAVDALRHVRAPSELALAGLPIIFAAHQLIETFVWWGLEGKVAWSTGRTALYVYLIIAFAVPGVAAAAVAAAESDRDRRRIMVVLSGIGVAVSLVLLDAVARGPVSADVADHHIAYQVHLGYGSQLVALYVLAACGPPLLSSHRRVVMFGVLNLVAVGVLGWLTLNGFISLWCVWAGITSVMIALHLRSAHGISPTRRAEAVVAP
jgi:hypothetical protein